MKPHVRAAVAAIALAHFSSRKVNSIYDYSDGVYKNIDAEINGGAVSGYDYGASCFIDGTIPSLYHYGESSFIDFTPKGNGKYDGYDYGSACFFEVTVNGNSAEVYDYGDPGYFSYSL